MCSLTKFDGNQMFCGNEDAKLEDKLNVTNSAYLTTQNHMVYYQRIRNDLEVLYIYRDSLT